MRKGKPPEINRHPEKQGTKSRKNLTFPAPVIELAVELMKLRRFDDLSSLISQLVREEFERRNGPSTFSAHALNEEPPPYRAKSAKPEPNKN